MVAVTVAVRMGRGMVDVWFIYFSGDYTYAGSILKSFSGAVIHEDVLGCLFDLQETLKKSLITPTTPTMWCTISEALSSEGGRLITAFVVLTTLATVILALFTTL
jgi:hypothetical protein